MKNLIQLKLCLLFIFGLLSFCHGQNLVPNPSFEDTLFCPWGPSLINVTALWTSHRESPDYYNSCAPSMPYPYVSAGVPSNSFGHQYAFDGNSYAGIGTYTEDSNFREYLGIQLTQALVPKQKYYLSCYISRAGAYPWDPFNGSGASNNFGFRFSMQPYSANNPCPIDNASHYHDTTIAIDSVNWTRISGSFVADTSYQYLSLGNFYNNSNTDTMNIRDNDTLHLNFAYYYIDYVCVTIDSLCQSTANINSSIIVNRINVFPNPFNSELKINSDNNEQLEIEIYDCTMKNIMKHPFTSSIILNTTMYNKGIYYYLISNNNGMISRGILIHE